MNNLPNYLLVLFFQDNRTNNRLYVYHTTPHFVVVVTKPKVRVV